MGVKVEAASGEYFEEQSTEHQQYKAYVDVAVAPAANCFQRILLTVNMSPDP